MKLPAAPAAYAQSDQAQMRGALERDAAQTLRRGVAEAYGLLSSPGGATWKLAVDDDGLAGLALRGTDDYGPPVPIGSRVVPLDTFAAQAGVKLGTGDDQPAFDKAEAAMDGVVAAMAAARATWLADHPGDIAGADAAGQEIPGLYVFIPPGIYLLRRLRLRNRCGYFGAPQASILRQRPPRAGEAPDPMMFVELADPYATGWLLSGLVMDGRYYFTDEADPRVFQYIPQCNVTGAAWSATDTPFGNGQTVFTVDRDYGGLLPPGGNLYVTGTAVAADSGDYGYDGIWPILSATATTVTVAQVGVAPGEYASGGVAMPRGSFATPDDGCHWGQGCIHLVNAFSGVDDPQYYSNSVFNSQNPRGLIEHVTIANWGGDGLYLEGAGAQRVQSVQIFNCQGRGLVLNSYDNNLSDLDIGGIGLEPLYLPSQGSASRISQIKTWYGGGRGIANHRMGWRLDLCGGVQISGEVQDMSGGGIDVTGGFNMQITALVDWQGLIGGADGSGMEADIAALTLRGNSHGASASSVYNISAGKVDHFDGDTPTALHPNVRRLVRTTHQVMNFTGGGRADFAPNGNTIILTQAGFPDDIGIDNPDWYDGPLDGNFVLKPGGGMRSPRQVTPADDGRAFYQVLVPEGGVGLVLGGPGAVSHQEGVHLAVHTKGWAATRQDGGAFTDSFTHVYVPAAGTDPAVEYAAAFKPLRVGQELTLAELSGYPPSLYPRCLIMVTDATGGAKLCISNTVNWMPILTDAAPVG